MKPIHKSLVVLVLLTLLSVRSYAQVGINTDQSEPDPSAMKDVKSTNSGLLIPRLTVTERNSILSPATGLLIYNTTNGLFNYFNGSQWFSVDAALKSNTTGTAQPGPGVAIRNTPGTLPDASAMLDVNDPAKGVLIPRTTPGSITLPTAGLIIYNSSTNLLNVYNGSQWIVICATSTGVTAPSGSQINKGVAVNSNGLPPHPSQNLGSDHQATAVSDATEASAGWYWQFNRMQGYKHDGTTRTPNTAWIPTINENSNWAAANDPCNILLGSTWRVPTLTEWANVYWSGNWTNWIGPWNSGLKLHAARSLNNTEGTLLYRGERGHYRSSSQYDIKRVRICI